MKYKDVSKLDDLCIRMDGLAGLGLAIRDSVITVQIQQIPIKMQ